jgi:hypothetical protein
LIMAVIPVMHGKFVKLTGDMISGAGVEILAGIIPMGSRCSCSRLGLRQVFFIKPIPTDVGGVTQP